MKRILMSLALVSLLLSLLAGCSSLRYKEGRAPEQHPGHVGHETHY